MKPKCPGYEVKVPTHETKVPTQKEEERKMKQYGKLGVSWDDRKIYMMIEKINRISSLRSIFIFINRGRLSSFL